MTLKAKPLRALLMGSLSLCYFVALAIYVYRGNELGLLRLLAIVCLAPQALSVLLAVVPGSVFVALDSTGFTACFLYRRRFFRWEDVGIFSVGRRRVVFNRSDTNQQNIRKRNLISRMWNDHDSSLPNILGLSLVQLAEEMNQARFRALADQKIAAAS